MSNFTLSKNDDNRLQSYNAEYYCGKFSFNPRNKTFIDLHRDCWDKPQGLEPKL